MLSQLNQQDALQLCFFTFIIDDDSKMSVCCRTLTHPAKVEDLGDGLGDEQDFGPVTSHN